MGRKSIGMIRSALTRTTAVNTPETARKTRAVSETRIGTREEEKTGTGRGTEREIRRGKKTRGEIRTEVKQGREIPTETGKKTMTIKEIETKNERKRHSVIKRATRRTGIWRMAITRYPNFSTID